MLKGVAYMRMVISWLDTDWHPTDWHPMTEFTIVLNNRKSFMKFISFGALTAEL